MYMRYGTVGESQLDGEEKTWKYMSGVLVVDVEGTKIVAKKRTDA